MHLPVLENQQINEPKARAMIRHAINVGVNYIDTAYPYHNGESKPFVGKALGNGYREKVQIATKLQSGDIISREDMDRILNDQRARLNTDHIDCYLVHGLNAGFWKILSRLGTPDPRGVADYRKYSRR